MIYGANYKKRCILNVISVAAIACILVLLAKPWNCYADYQCVYCQAAVTRHYFFFIELPGVTHEGKLTRYWKINVEPNHEHYMQMSHAHNANGLWADINDYFFEGWAGMPEDAAIKILRSLPTPEARKSFVEKHLQNMGSDPLSK